VLCHAEDSPAIPDHLERETGSLPAGVRRATRILYKHTHSAQASVQTGWLGSCFSADDSNTQSYGGGLFCALAGGTAHQKVYDTTTALPVGTLNKKHRRLRLMVERAFSA